MSLFSSIGLGLMELFKFGKGTVFSILFFWNHCIFTLMLGFLGGSAGKESTCNVGDLGSVPGMGRSPGEGKGYPLQYCGLENSMDCLVHGVTKSWTRLSDWTEMNWTKTIFLLRVSIISEDFISTIADKEIVQFVTNAFRKLESIFSQGFYKLIFQDPLKFWCLKVIQATFCPVYLFFLFLLFLVLFLSFQIMFSLLFCQKHAY